MSEISMRWGILECGFFRYLGKIYFAMPHGRMVFHFPIKDGKISKYSDGSNIYPGAEISVIPIQDMVNHGMQIKQGDDPFDEQFWS